MLLSSFGCLNNNRGRTDNLPPVMALVNCFLLPWKLNTWNYCNCFIEPGHIVVAMLKAMPEGHIKCLVN